MLEQARQNLEKKGVSEEDTLKSFSQQLYFDCNALLERYGDSKKEWDPGFLGLGATQFVVRKMLMIVAESEDKPPVEITIVGAGYQYGSPDISIIINGLEECLTLYRDPHHYLSPSRIGDAKSYLAQYGSPQFKRKATLEEVKGWQEVVEITKQRHPL